MLAVYFYEFRALPIKKNYMRLMTFYRPTCVYIIIHFLLNNGTATKKYQHFFTRTQALKEIKKH